MPVSRFAPHLAVLTLSLISLGARGADDGVRVLRYESVAIDFQAPQSASAMKSATVVSSMKFTAFGKNYSATLQPNANIAIPATASAQAYRGTLEGTANSWLRITRVGEEVHGLIFDGVELFAIEPAAEVDSAGPSSGTTIFRLADTQTDLGAEFCTASPGTGDPSGLDLYKSLSGESKALLGQLQKSGARARLQLSALTDTAFRNRYETDANATNAIVARINNIDGIFSSQLGVEVELTGAVHRESPVTPWFSGTSPDTLLKQTSKLRGESSALYATGITHLFTGKDMDGSTVGIAYIDAVCGQNYGASLSEARDRGAWFDSLVAAHELGHSFGSSHDGEGECASVPAGFLMSATINGNDRFSQCSLNRMQQRVQTASCLIPIPVADISLPATLTEYHAEIDHSFSWSIAVSNIGNADSLDSRVQINVPAALNVSAIVADIGSCTVGAGVVACDLGALGKLETRNIALTLKSSQAGTYSIGATVSARTDTSTSNNTAAGTIQIVPSVDVAIAMNAPGTVALDQSFNATFSLTNRSGLTAPIVTVDVVIPQGLSLSGSAQLDGTACGFQFQTLRCTVNSLAAGRTVTGTLAFVAREAGPQTLTLNLDGAYSDPQPLDNTAQKIVVVSAPPTSVAAITTSPAEESGGGAWQFNSLLLLSGLAYLRRRFGAASG